jgi:hypothetical protein
MYGKTTSQPPGAVEHPYISTPSPQYWSEKAGIENKISKEMKKKRTGNPPKKNGRLASPGWPFLNAD